MRNNKFIVSKNVKDVIKPASINEKNGLRTKISADEAAFISLEIGEHILICGGEVSRVEDTVRRICTAYGAESVDVFAIMSFIILTAEFDGVSVTQSRRISGDRVNNFYRLEKLNNLSRTICCSCPVKREVIRNIDDIYKSTEQKAALHFTGFALTASGLTLFFGGTLVDSLCSGAIALFMCMLTRFFARPVLAVNRLIREVVVCFSGGVMAILFAKLGHGINSDKVIIGSLMNVVPGVSFTNSLRDLLGGDLMTGVFRLAEVLIDAVAIASGYALAILLLGSM